MFGTDNSVLAWETGMKLSTFGMKFAAESGIVELMDDLESALLENPEMIMMGGGNPGRLPLAGELFRQSLENILDDSEKRHSLFGLYQAPRGNREFRIEIAAYLKKQFGWCVTEDNIAVSNGSQSAFFVLFNMLAGGMPDGTHQTMHLPLTPEYLGYADSGLREKFISSTRPEIRLLDDNLFKYQVDFERLKHASQIGALCVSRPTNPTGNVLTDEEISHLDDIAGKKGIPFIIDGAYGLPFPNILFTEASPHWNENTILVLSLSKLGLPGVRTGIIVAGEEVIAAYANANAIINLACGNIGPAIATELFRSGKIDVLANEHIAPFYLRRAREAVDAFRTALHGLPYRIHKPEGAFFLWLWFEGLPISSQELYQRLKKRGVLVVPGHHCFFGLDEEWQHQFECIRVSYVQDPEQVQRGIQIIADEVRKLF